jgi:hypothetical protein
VRGLLELVVAGGGLVFGKGRWVIGLWKRSSKGVQGKELRFG